MEKFERCFPVDRVRTDEPFDLRPIADTKTGRVKMPDLGEFVSDPFILCDAVEVASFDHERPRANQGRHFRVVKCGSQIELKNLVFGGS